MNKFAYTVVTCLFCFFISMFFIGELIERKKYENKNI